VADAAWYILQQPSDHYTGQFLIDEEVLASQGITDLSGYAYVPGNQTFYPDLFVDA
jgi:citronellol/citronellal dehydrogenase